MNAPKDSRESFPVIFRMEGSGEERDCVAFFPYGTANHGRLVCYAHIGQHSEATLEYYGRTQPATESEYADLLAELRSIYEADGDLALTIRRRLPHDWRSHAWKQATQR